MPREFIEMDYLRDRPFNRLAAFIDLISLANWQGSSWNGEAVQPGTVISSEGKLADRWGRSRGWVRRFLNALERERLAVQIADTERTLLSLVNFQTYQGVSIVSDLLERPPANETRTELGTHSKKKKKKVPPHHPTPPSDDGFFGNLIPENLNIPEFVSAWKDWLTYKSQRKEKYVASGVSALMGKLSKWGPRDAASNIRHSMAEGWQGIYPPRVSTISPAITPSFDNRPERRVVRADNGHRSPTSLQAQSVINQVTKQLAIK